MKVSIKNCLGLSALFIANAACADNLRDQMLALKSEMEQVKQVLDQKLTAADKDYADLDKKVKEDHNQKLKTAQGKGINVWELPLTDKEYADRNTLLINVEKAEGFSNGLRIVKDTLNQLIERLTILHPNFPNVSWKTGFVHLFAAEILKLQHTQEWHDEAASQSGVFGVKAKGVVEALKLGLEYLRPLLAKAQSIVQ